jgi:hypothetical protein
MKKKQALLALVMCLVVGTSSPAAAMSTSKEIDQGTQENQTIDSESVIITDPFLNAWVNGIGDKLAANRQRRDITFRFTILGEPDINAFAIKGGYVHVNLGLLNFVSSDDELAAILGHEMGHVELRHVVKADNTNNIIGILTALASMVSPVALALGSVSSELIGAKFSRIDELAADKYGLMLMAKTGYDPQAVVDMMKKLGAMEPGPDSRADRAFVDHPVPSQRVAHLEGYPELDRQTPEVIVTDSQHDQSEGLYTYAKARLLQAEQQHVSPDSVTQEMKELDYALRESGSKAAPDSRVVTHLATADDPTRKAARAQVEANRLAIVAAVQQAKEDARKGGDEAQVVNHELEVLTQNMPAPPPGMGAPGGRGPMSTLLKDMTGTLSFSSDVFQTAPGLLLSNRDTIVEMSQPLEDPGPLTPRSQALLAYYPSMNASFSWSTTMLLASIEDARTAIRTAHDAGEATREALSEFQPPPQTQSVQGTHASGAPWTPPAGAGDALHRAIVQWDTALAQARRASDEMYVAQAVGLSSEITLLDVLSSPERYEDFRKAVEYRLPGISMPDFATLNASGVAPGEYVCAAWYAFERHQDLASTAPTVLNRGESCPKVALDEAMMGESLEIATGLVLEDYTDTPQQL